MEKGRKIDLSEWTPDSKNVSMYRVVNDRGLKYYYQKIDISRKYLPMWKIDQNKQIFEPDGDSEDIKSSFSCTIQCNTSKYKILMQSFPRPTYKYQRGKLPISKKYNHNLMLVWGKGFADSKVFDYHRNIYLNGSQNIQKADKYFPSNSQLEFANQKEYEKFLFFLADKEVDDFWKYQKLNKLDAAFFKKYYRNLEPGQIPELYHITWFNCRVFTLAYFITFYSLLKTSSPYSKIIFHTNCIPDFTANKDGLFRKILELGKDKILINKVQPCSRILDHVRYEKIKPNDLISHNGSYWSGNRGLNQQYRLIYSSGNTGNTVNRIEHISDYFRLLVLIKYGGVYLDDGRV